MIERSLEICHSIYMSKDAYGALKEIRNMESKY